MKRWKRNDYLRFHIREFGYLPDEIRGNFHNDVREYLSYIVRKYPALQHQV